MLPQPDPVPQAAAPVAEASPPPAKPAKAAYDYAIDNFRGIAICLVIASHLGTLGSFGPLSKYLVYLIKDGTSWFVFISGYLFYRVEHRRFEYRPYLVKKFKFVVLPYLLLSTVPIAAGIYYSRPELIGLSRAGYVGWSLAVGGSMVTPLWFIPMIVIFFLLSPLFQGLSKSRWVHAVAIAGITFSLFSGRPYQSLNPYLAFLHFLGFYLLGISLAVAAPAVDRLVASRFARWVIGACLVVFCAGAVLYPGPGPDIGFFNALGQLNHIQLGKLSLLIAVLLGLKLAGGRRNPVLGYLAERSFGLFFLHGFFILLFGRLVGHFSWFSESLPNELLLAVGGSILLIEATKRVFGKWSRYVIGC